MSSTLPSLTWNAEYVMDAIELGSSPYLRNLTQIPTMPFWSTLRWPLVYILKSWPSTLKMGKCGLSRITSMRCFTPRRSTLVANLTILVSTISFISLSCEALLIYQMILTLKYITSSRHSKKLYAWETGPAEDISLLLLCGECDFKVGNDLFDALLIWRSCFS